MKPASDRQKIPVGRIFVTNVSAIVAHGSEGEFNKKFNEETEQGRLLKVRQPV